MDIDEAMNMWACFALASAAVRTLYVFFHKVFLKCLLDELFVVEDADSHVLVFLKDY